MTEQDSADSLYAAGGPGDSGVAELGITVFKEILLQATGGVYDIIAWDPRGVGTLTTSVSFFQRVSHVAHGTCLAQERSSASTALRSTPRSSMERSNSPGLRRPGTSPILQTSTRCSPKPRSCRRSTRSLARSASTRLAESTSSTSELLLRCATWSRLPMRSMAPTFPSTTSVYPMGPLSALGS